MCDIIFEKMKGVYIEATTHRGSFKKVLLEISQNSQENMCRNLFFDKVKLCRSADKTQV